MVMDLAPWTSRMEQNCALTFRHARRSGRAGRGRGLVSDNGPFSDASGSGRVSPPGLNKKPSLDAYTAPGSAISSGARGRGHQRGSPRREGEDARAEAHREPSKTPAL